jgi:hypothetical protein
MGAKAAICFRTRTVCQFIKKSPAEITDILITNDRMDKKNEDVFVGALNLLTLIGSSLDLVDLFTSV